MGKAVWGRDSQAAGVRLIRLLQVHFGGRVVYVGCRAETGLREGHPRRAQLSQDHGTALSTAGLGQSTGLGTSLGAL